jgi:hypothetical protein
MSKKKDVITNDELLQYLREIFTHVIILEDKVQDNSQGNKNKTK